MNLLRSTRYTALDKGGKVFDCYFSIEYTAMAKNTLDGVLDLAAGLLILDKIMKLLLSVLILFILQYIIWETKKDLL